MVDGSDGRRGDGPAPERARRPRIPTLHTTVSGNVDLARLINWSTPLAWFEAVAIVQGLCEVLLATRREGLGGNLEPGDVAITPQGGVEVRGGIGQGLPAVASIAHLLLALLEEAQALPVQLRLLALEATAPLPAQATLREWSARLAAFERPGRQRIIREVHERFTQLPARDMEPPAKPSVRTAVPSAPRRWRTSPRLRNAALAVALLAGAGVAAAWLWQVVGPVLSEAGKRPRDGAMASAEADESFSAAAAARIRAAAFRIWGAAPSRPATPGPDAALTAQPIVVELTAGPPTVAPWEADELAPPRGVPAAARPTPADTAVYSAEDATVLPPTLLRPRLPTRPGTGVREENLPQVELLVSPSGEVESVKLLTQPARVMSAMMLSAIKTWRFAPASREGRAVRYRLRLRLTNE